MVTLFLAAMIGWYLVIMSLFLFFRYQEVRSIMGEILSQRALLFIIAIITLILGLLIVLSHNVWIMHWPVVITIFGWIVLIAGIVRLFFAEAVSRVWRYILDGPQAYIMIFAGISLFIGLFLLYNVYWH